MKLHPIRTEKTFSDIMEKAWNIKLMLLHVSSLIYTLESKILQKSPTKCFRTVKYYNSNEAASAKHETLLVFRNDDYLYVPLRLTCNNDLMVHLKSIQLSLPGNIRDYCLESKHSNQTMCREKDPCDCCEVPHSRCYKNVTERYRTFCVENSTCNLNIQSEFLKDCIGRQYNCDNEKCHSRWVEVSYICSPITVKTMNTTKSAIIGTKPTTELLHKQPSTPSSRTSDPQSDAFTTQPLDTTQFSVNKGRDAH